MISFICILTLAIVGMVGGYLIVEHTDMEEGGVLLICGVIILVGIAALTLI